LPAGGKHALACALFDSGHAGRLVAAVAEQCGQLCAAATNPQDLNENVSSGSQRYRTWQKIESTLARLPNNHPQTVQLGNLLTRLFAANQIGAEAEIDKIASAWKQVQDKTREALS
jgi:hypothetical protein